MSPSSPKCRSDRGGAERLFGASGDGPSAEGIVAGLSAWDAVVTPGEEAALTAAIDACALSPFRFQGWEGRRLTASFGWRYDFDTGAFGPTAPLPDWLLPVRDPGAALAGLAADALVQALVIRYDPGAGIGRHRDRPQFEHVVGLSLGSPATLRLRRRTAAGRAGFARASAPLTPRGLYHMTGDVRHLWEHSIAPGDARRWSITFRSLSEKGRGAA